MMAECYCVNGIIPGVLIRRVPCVRCMSDEEVESYACFGCRQVWECEYAWDSYNRGTDCLAEK